MNFKRMIILGIAFKFGSIVGDDIYSITKVTAEILWKRFGQPCIKSWTKAIIDSNNTNDEIIEMAKSLYKKIETREKEEAKDKTNPIGF